jgi:Trypsin
VPNNSVVVTVAPGYSLKALDMVARSSADAGVFRFEVSPLEAPAPFLNIVGGFPFSATLDCSIGFATYHRTTGSRGFVTAGHCGAAGAYVYMSSQLVGRIQQSVFPGSDAAWSTVRPTDILYGKVTKYDGTFQSVSGNTEAALGAAVCRSGAQTGWSCGVIQHKEVTVNFSKDLVYNLTQTNACAGTGDSGGSWITGSGQAQGVTSGGVLPPGQNNNCREIFNRTTYFQPINPILATFGLNLQPPV